MDPGRAFLPPGQYRRPGLAGQAGYRHPGIQGHPAAPLGADLFIQGSPRFARNDRSQPAWPARVVALWHLRRLSHPAGRVGQSQTDRPGARSPAGAQISAQPPVYDGCGYPQSPADRLRRGVERDALPPGQQDEWGRVVAPARRNLYPLWRPDEDRGTHPAADCGACSSQRSKWIVGQSNAGYSIPVHHLPEFTPTRQAEVTANAARTSSNFPLEEKGDLKFYNGYGGFSADGREYIIDWNASNAAKQGLPPSRTTPAPWVNVIGYPEFGFMVSEAGSQCTWALNSGENRLTPWSNDPVRDPTGEALYLRDEETGEVWTPTPLPAGADQPYRVTHGAGYTIFEHNSHGLRQYLTLFASPEDPVKIIHLKVENTLDHTRRITATQYVEWVLGTTHAASMAYIIPEYDSAQECLLATNPYNAEFGTRVAFLIASKAIHGLTADRTEFLGRGGTPAFPAALHRLGLETRITPGEDPCAVLQIHLDLLPGAAEEIYFVLGQGNDKEHALALARKYHDPAYVSAAYERTHVFWDQLLDTVQVHTPEPATDLILNRWMLYQTLSCRIWGRTGFYQSSGAFGFRDQLQDVLALLPIDPAITRSQILNAAQHQFEEGDVMHWWHPPSGRGVRTRFSDDLLWLPYVTALYIEATGDTSYSGRENSFLECPTACRR